MEKVIRSLHHVTATVADAQEDLDFYGRLLGMRLVKRTINFDNHNVFHFYYGDERGTPGTLMTTFPYGGWSVPVGRKGPGQIAVTSFSVPEQSLDYWRRRVRDAGVAVNDDQPRFGQESIVFQDPSGLHIELVGARDERAPWVGGDVSEEAAVRGLHSVTMLIRNPERTVQLMTEVLGFDIVNESESRTRLAVNGNVAGHLMEIVRTPDGPAAANGLGTVHHVAMAVSDAEEQLRMRDELIGLGYAVTEVRDRQYFLSIYFREPGGVLFEIATVPPGFAIDEELAHLGRDLKLPPWEEPHRGEIEAVLPPIFHG